MSRRRNRPCAVCGRTKKLSRHHFIPKEFRVKGRQQKTMKLCKDQSGCQTHLKFHLGDIKAAMRIRNQMTRWQYNWLVAEIGSEWVDKTYPR